MSNGSCSQHHSLNRIHDAFFLCLGLHFGIRHVYLSGTSTGWRRFSINHLSWSRIFVFSKLMGVEKCSWKMGSDSRVVDPKMMDLVKSWPNIKYPHNVKLAYIYIYIPYKYSLYKCLDIWDSGTNWVGFRRVLPWKQFNEGFFEAVFFCRWWSDLIHLHSPVFLY